MLRQALAFSLLFPGAALAAPVPPNPLSLEAAFEAGVDPLAPWGGDIRRLRATYGGEVLEGLRFDLGARLDREWNEPATDQPLIDHWRARTTWLHQGGMPPGLLFGLEEACLTIPDPSRSGALRFGQFYRPFGYADFTSFAPPPAIAPTLLPLLSSVGVKQPSTLTYGRDIGAMLTGESPGYSYWVALLNGSGPDRMDENSGKDWLFRLDLRPNEQAELGLSYQNGWENSFLENAAFHRQDWGLHAKVQGEGYTVRGEYVLAHRYGLDDRRGWYLDFQGDGSYLQGGESAILSENYNLRYASVGWRKVQAGLSGGVEYTSFWEFLPGRELQSNRVLSWIGFKI